MILWVILNGLWVIFIWRSASFLYPMVFLAARPNCRIYLYSPVVLECCIIQMGQGYKTCLRKKMRGDPLTNSCTNSGDTATRQSKPVSPFLQAIKFYAFDLRQTFLDRLCFSKPNNITSNTSPRIPNNTRIVFGSFVFSGRLNHFL